jgi:hypothetical protein
LGAFGSGAPVFGAVEPELALVTGGPGFFLLLQAAAVNRAATTRVLENVMT